MKYLKYIDKYVTSQKGKTFIVTGATSGIGRALAFQLAYKDANVILACRNISKANKVKEEILKQFPNANIEIAQYDQADFSSIDNFVNSIKDRKIDCLVLNAGIYHCHNDLTTVDGYPLTVGTNYIGAFYLCSKLDEKFKNGDIKRVVVTSSIVHRFGKTKHYEKYLLNVKNKPNRTYNVSKKMNYDFAANLKTAIPNLEVVLTHPGLARTSIIKEDHSSLPLFIKYAGDRFLKIFANSAEKSAICTLFASTKDLKFDLEYVIPRGLFHLVGYPKIKYLNPSKIKNESLELATKKIVA